MNKRSIYFTQVNGQTINLNELIDIELDLQLEWRVKIEWHEKHCKFNSEYRRILEVVKASSERVTNYYTIKENIFTTNNLHRAI